jgi:hypothetical protein
LEDILESKNVQITPFDYIKPFFQGFPELLALRQLLPDMLNFALTMHSLKGTCAEELFFGALLASLQISGWALNSSQKADLDLLIVKKTDSEAVGAKIVEEYGKVLGDTSVEAVPPQLGL